MNKITKSMFLLLISVISIITKLYGQDYVDYDCRLGDSCKLYLEVYEKRNSLATNVAGSCGSVTVENYLEGTRKLIDSSQVNKLNWR